MDFAGAEAKINVNEQEPLFSLVYIRFGAYKVLHFCAMVLLVLDSVSANIRNLSSCGS